jgi:hypothetical protein
MQDCIQMALTPRDYLHLGLRFNQDCDSGKPYVTGLLLELLRVTEPPPPAHAKKHTRNKPAGGKGGVTQQIRMCALA